jgi:hypothetical protein
LSPLIASKSARIPFRDRLAAKCKELSPSPSLTFKSVPLLSRLGQSPVSPQE